MKGAFLWGSLFKKETFLSAVVETAASLFKLVIAFVPRQRVMGMADGDAATFGKNQETGRT